MRVRNLGTGLALLIRHIVWIGVSDSVRTRKPNNIARIVQTNGTCCDTPHRLRERKKWCQMDRKFNRFQTACNVCPHCAITSIMARSDCSMLRPTLVSGGCFARVACVCASVIADSCLVYWAHQRNCTNAKGKGSKRRNRLLAILGGGKRQSPNWKLVPIDSPYMSICR